MAKTTNLVLEVLREIRDEIRSTREELSGRIDAVNMRLDGTNTRLDGTNARLEAVEHGLLDLAEQQRFVVSYLQAITQRDHRFDRELAGLRARIDAIEERLPP